MDIWLYLVARDSTSRTREQWFGLLDTVLAHPVIAQINSASTVITDEVTMTPYVSGDDTAVAVALSFRLREALRANMQTVAGTALTDADNVDAITQAQTIDVLRFGAETAMWDYLSEDRRTLAQQYGVYFTMVAHQMALTDIAIRLIGYSEDQDVAAAALNRYRASNLSAFGSDEL